ncbi:MAG: hypothetical protein C0418_04815 [Coriobacteriaceae bacterium]|nr:hypothetical protein [Coriobacteriaceae bacterium]
MPRQPDLPRGRRVLAVRAEAQSRRKIRHRRLPGRGACALDLRRFDENKAEQRGNRDCDGEAQPDQVLVVHRREYRRAAAPRSRHRPRRRPAPGATPPRRPRPHRPDRGAPPLPSGYTRPT